MANKKTAETKKLEVEKEKVNVLEEEVEEVRKFIKMRSYDFISAGLGIVAGFAWNEAIKSLIDYLFPLSQNSIVAKFIYAVFITLFVILITFYFSKVMGIKPKHKSKEAKDKEEKERENK
ncbi:MAG: DUF5654 family protein [Candidatus Margulisiibacteriota bacterium]|jgi:hypothetical protein